MGSRFLNSFLGAEAPSGATRFFFLPMVGGKYSDFGSTLETTNGANLSQWGLSTAAAVYVGGTHLTLDTGTTHLGNATVRFPGNAFFQFGSLSGFSGAVGAEIYSVLKADSDTTATDRPAWKFMGGGAPHGGRGTGWPLSNANLRFSFASQNDVYDRDPTTFTPPVSISSGFHLLNIKAKTNFYQVRIDGVLVYSNTTHQFQLDNSTPRLGLDELSGVQFLGHQSGLVLYQGVLNSAETAQNEAYFMSGTGSPL